MTAIELLMSKTPLCPRCTAPVLLAARYPHVWCNQAGEHVDGLKESVLCRSCDAGDPAAAGLLALLTHDGQLNAASLTAFGRLVQHWLDAVRHRAPDRAALDSEEARWRAGEL
jgi:ribosomal protein S27AE